MEEETEVIESEEPTKEDLERKKLLLEIEELKMAWWKKPNYILAAFPTLLAIVSLIYGLTSGYFQAMAIKLENQKRDMQMQVEEIVKERDKSKAELEELKKQKEEYDKEIAQQKELVKSYESAISSLPSESEKSKITENIQKGIEKPKKKK